MNAEVRFKDRSLRIELMVFNPLILVSTFENQVFSITTLLPFPNIYPIHHF
jgi:hypothetical protein